MNLTAAIIIVIALLIGPVAVPIIEHNIDLFILAIGIIAAAFSADRGIAVFRSALTAPIAITVAVLAAGLIFRELRDQLDKAFTWLRARISRPILTGISLFVLAMLSSVISSIVAALVLVEIVGVLHIRGEHRTDVVVAGCFAIGLGSALTPAGGPLSTIAAHGLNLGYRGLFDLLAPSVIPGVVASCILAGYFASGEYYEAPPGPHVRETWLDILVRGAKVFGFVAGLVLIGEAYAPLAMQIVPRLSRAALFWANTSSAVLDNATLMALEAHAVNADRARESILALLISGGMLIPGNIPNVISAGALGIPSGKWARIAVPIGAVMLGIYFVALQIPGLRR